MRRAVVLASAAIALLGVVPAAQGAPLGVNDFFGNPTSEPGFAGGEFSVPVETEGPLKGQNTTGTAPKGIAVNDATGDVYVADDINDRIQRFDADGAFKSAWGADVIPGGATGTGNIENGSKEVSSVVATGKAFRTGQLVTGEGIPVGTRINSVALGAGAASKLVLSKAATKSQNGVTLTVAEGAGNVPVNERMLITVTATEGNYKLGIGATNGFGGATTENIPYNASPNVGPESLQARLEAKIGAGNVAVTSPNAGGTPNVPGGPYTIEFKGKLADTNVATLSVSAGSPPLIGGSATRATLVEGAGAYEVCTVAAECQPANEGSGEAAFGGTLNEPVGVAVNQSTGHLYVTNQRLGRIEEFSESGGFVRAFGIGVVQSGKPGDNPPASAKQTLTVTATSGKYTLEFQGQKTGELAAGPSGASAADVQTALNGLSSISGGGGSASVSGSTGGPYSIAFGGSLANNPEPDIAAASAVGDPLVGGTASVATTTPGSNGFEICNSAEDCQRGTGGEGPGGFATFAGGGGYLTVAPVGAPDAGNVLVADPFGARIQEFAPNGSFVRMFGWDVAKAGPGDTGTGFEICQAASFDVCKRGSKGSGVGQFVEGLNRVAADSAGNIYTVESGKFISSNLRVQKFTAAGGGLTPSIFNPSIGGSETLSGTGASSAPTDVAVDPSNDHLYVTRAFAVGKGTPSATSEERRVLEFDPSGTLVETHIAGYGVNSVNGLAVKAGGSRAYVTSGLPKPGVSILGAPLPPTPLVTATTAIGEHGATLNGTVNPNGGGAQHTFYRFEYSSNGGSSWTKATPTDTDVGSGEADVPVSQVVSGLEANKDYLVRIVATKGGLPTVSTPGGAFKTSNAAPLAETLNAWWDGNSAELVLKARVNPQNEPTTYFFQYGTEDCSSNPCASFPASEDAFAGEAGKDLIVTKTIPGLDTSTGYHYRVVAVNPSGTVFGADREIGTGPSTAPCPNQALREENDSTELPECRAYELVSNANSKGIGTASIRGISDDGERVMIEAQTLGEPTSLLVQNSPFPAGRTAAGWEIPRYGPLPTGGFSNIFGAAPFSAALDIVLWAQSTAHEWQEGEVNWIRAHSDGSNELVAHLAPLAKTAAPLDNASFQFVGGSPDLSTFIFGSHFETPHTAATYVPGEPLVVSNQVEAVNLYRAAGAGTPLALVNRDATGTPIANVCGVQLGGLPSSANEDPRGLSARPVSRDGSVIYFNARPGAATTGESDNCNRSAFKARVFKRIGDSETVEVSKSQCTRTVPTPCSPINGDDVFQGASADGQSVLISSTRQLTDSDEDATNDLYLYDASPPSGQPTLIQVSAGEANADHPKAGSGAEVQGVVESSADGSRTYFVAKGRLTTTATQGANNLYLFERDDAHPTGRLVFIAVLPAADSGLWSAQSRQAHVMPFYGSGGAGAGDGRLLFFVTAARLAAEDTDSAADLYRYDDESEALSCISCQGDGAFDVSIAANANGNPLRSNPQYVQEGRVAAEDGASVVFSTKEALLPGDQNSAEDVYEWNEGILSLISGGAGAAGSFSKALISPDAKRIVFQTKTKLYPTDQNTSLDVYAASVDGGFPLPPDPVSKCEDGQACRGPAPAPPLTSAPASAGVSGSGNVPPKAPKGCKGGKVKRKGRCVNPKPKKKASKHHSKRAHNHKRGGNR